MKLKLMITLVILALVFGMVLTACDDGEMLKIKEDADTATQKNTVYDKFFLGNEGAAPLPAGTYIDTDAAPTTGQGYLVDPLDDTTTSPVVSDWVVWQNTPTGTDPDTGDPIYGNADKSLFDYLDTL